MDRTEYRDLIEKMGAKENIINHMDNILDLLLPAGGDGFLHIGPGECRTVMNWERRSWNG